MAATECLRNVHTRRRRDPPHDRRGPWHRLCEGRSNTCFSLSAEQNGETVGQRPRVSAALVFSISYHSGAGMKQFLNAGRKRCFLAAGAGCLLLLLTTITSFADTPATVPTSEPATQPAAATATPPITDPSGSVGGGNSLIQPNSTLPGWQGGGTDSKGVWHPYTDEKGNPTDTPNATSLAPNVAKAFYSINFIWTLVCGFLVMFMQAGFALVETGLMRGKNAGHTMSMNFLIYAWGCSASLFAGSRSCAAGPTASQWARDASIGGPGQLGGLPSLDHMWRSSAAQPWGMCGLQGFFLTAKAMTRRPPSGSSSKWSSWTPRPPS